MGKRTRSRSRPSQDMVLVNTRCHESASTNSYFVTIAECISDTIGVCPCQFDLHLDEYLDIDIIDDAYDRSDGRHTETSVNFSYGGYRVRCWFSGEVQVFAPEEEYEAGTVALPDSMHCNQHAKYRDKSPRSRS